MRHQGMKPKKALKKHLKEDENMEAEMIKKDKKLEKQIEKKPKKK